MIQRMIGAVNIATAYRKNDGPESIAFVGAKDRHLQVNPETIARNSDVLASKRLNRH